MADCVLLCATQADTCHAKPGSKHRFLDRLFKAESGIYSREHRKGFQETVEWDATAKFGS